jgi:adenosylhomocysteine nucleosidase
MVSAMYEVLSAVLAPIPDERNRQVAGRDFLADHLHGQEVVAVLSHR